MSLILGIVAVGLLWWLLKSYLKVDVATLAPKLQRWAGFGAIAGAVVLGLRGRIDVAIFLGGLGAWLIGWGGRPAWLGGPQAAPARFRSRLLELVFDPARQDIQGTVIAGQLAGTPLAAIDLRGLIDLRRECFAADPGGVGLLEAYLDGRFPGWRQHAEPDADPGRAVRRDPGALSEEEAYQVLGLDPGASPEAIRLAHRALIKKLHPDQGGTTDLAARVNAAKDVLLRRHR